MKLFNANRDVISAIRTRRPRMSWTQGRNWDVQHKMIDGRPVTFYYEVARGTRLYFKWADQWYVARMFQNTDPFDFHVLTTN